MNKKRFLGLCVLLMVSGASVVYAGMADVPWPRYHRDAQSTGCAPAGTPFFTEPVIVWQVTVGVGNREENQSTPLIGPDAVYVSSNTGWVYKLDKSDGSVIWSYDSNGGITPQGSIQAGGVLGRGVGSGPEEFMVQATGYNSHPDNHIFKLDTATGAVLWSDHYLHETGQRDSLSSANMDAAGNVYTAVGDMDWGMGHRAWQMRKYGPGGSLLWSQYPSPELSATFGVGGPCSLSADETISYWCSSEDWKIWALNNSDGSIRWSVRTEKYFWAAAPAVNSQGTIYVANDFGRLYSVDGDTGTVLWSLVLIGIGRTDVNSVPAIREIQTETLSTATRIYIASNGSIHCVEDDGSGQGVQKWSIDITRDHSGVFTYSSPVLTQDGAIYVASPTDKKAYAFFDAGDVGVKMWEMTVGGGLKGTRGLSIDTDGSLYVNSKNGNVYKLFGSVLSAGQISIVNESPLPDAKASVPQSIQLLAVPLSTSYTWAVVGGSLPPGCQINAATGEITGTPEMAGVYSFTVQVTDSQNPPTMAAKEFSWNIAPLSLQIITTSAHNGEVYVSYRATVFQKIGSEGPFAWSNPQGTISPGLQLQQVGEQYVLSGIPTAEGVYTFRIQVSDATTSQTYEYEVEMKDYSPWTTLADDPCLFPYRDADTPPPMNTPMKRCNMGAVGANGKLYVMCGNGIDYNDGSKTYSEDQQATFSIYRPETDTWDCAYWRDWSALSHQPGGYSVNGQPTGYNNNSVEEKPLFWMGTGECLNHGCAYDKDGDGTEEIFLFGGGPIWYGAGAIYDPDTNKWAYTPEKPDFWGGSPDKEMREGVVDNLGADMYLFAGRDNGPAVDGDRSREMMVYHADTRSWTLLAAAPISFARHCGNIVNGRFYAISGSQGGTGFQTAVMAYDIAADTWITGLSPIPVGVNRSTCVSSGDKIIVLGGLISSTTPTDLIQVYDTTSDLWYTSTVSLPMPNSAFAAAVVGGDLIIADGSLASYAEEVFTNSAFKIPVYRVLYGEPAEITGISMNPSGNIEITWSSVKGATYSVESSTDAYGSSMTWITEEAGIPGQAGSITWEDTSTPLTGEKYYRVGRE